VSGYCHAGRMLAVMGRSGAGKTTLLDVLACHTRGGVLTGDVLVNGQPRDTSAFARSSCYVMQQDILLHTATVGAPPDSLLRTNGVGIIPRSVIVLQPSLYLPSSCRPPPATPCDYCAAASQGTTAPSYVPRALAPCCHPACCQLAAS
jgi:hypothetical protein